MGRRSRAKRAYAKALLHPTPARGVLRAWLGDLPAAQPTAVFTRFEDLERPVLEVSQTVGADWVLRIRSDGPEEHLTLHRQADGLALLTHRSRSKPRSVWDETRVKIARKLGYLHAERHGDYYQHRKLLPMTATEGDFLVGKRIDLGSTSMKAKYTRMARVDFVAPGPVFMLKLYLFAGGHSLMHDRPHVVTPFGELCFGLDPL